MRMTRAARAVRPSLLLAPRLPLRAAGTAAACRQFSAGSLNSHAEHQREVVDELRSLYEDDEYYTDALTQLSHGLQGAALAEQAGAEPSMVVAALLHDVGWKLAKTAPWLEETDEMVVGADADLTADCPDDSLASQLGILAFCGSGGASLAAQQAQHDTIGATFLRMRGVDEAVCTLVEGHVLAKRYLCYAEEGYYEALSPGSIATLRFQGGVMGPDEAAIFEASPFFEDCLTMRRFDEESKIEGLHIPPWEHYEEKISALVVRGQRTAEETREVSGFQRDGNMIVGIQDLGQLEAMLREREGGADEGGGGGARAKTAWC